MDIHPPGTRIAGRYEVAGRPLIGGMSIVYLCFDHETDRPVALKTFKSKYLPDKRNEVLSDLIGDSAIIPHEKGSIKPVIENLLRFPSFIRISATDDILPP